jgi:hypothetical protein
MFNLIFISWTVSAKGFPRPLSSRVPSLTIFAHEKAATAEAMTAM